MAVRPMCKRSRGLTMEPACSCQQERVYGSSTLYRLDLSDRRVYELIASMPDHDVEILRVTPKSIRYRFGNVETGATKDGEVLIRERRGK